MQVCMGEIAGIEPVGISKPKMCLPWFFFISSKTKTLSVVKASKWGWEEVMSSFEERLKVRSALTPHPVLKEWITVVGAVLTCQYW